MKALVSTVSRRRSRCIPIRQMSIVEKIKKLRADWKQMNEALEPIDDTYEEIPNMTLKTFLFEIPNDLKMKAFRDSWKMVKLSFSFSREKQRALTEIVLKEDEAIKAMEQEIKKRLAKEFELRYGFPMNKIEQISNETSEKKSTFDFNDSNINLEIDKITEEISKNTMEMFRTLRSKEGGIKLFVENRLQIMQESVQDFMEGYREGKKASLETVLSSEDYVEELTQKVSGMKEKVMSNFAMDSNGAPVDVSQMSAKDKAKRSFDALTQYLENKIDEKAAADGITISKEEVDENIEKHSKLLKERMDSLVEEPLQSMSTIIEDAEKEQERQELERKERLEAFFANASMGNYPSYYDLVMNRKEEQLLNQARELPQSRNLQDDSTSKHKISKSIDSFLSKLERNVDDQISHVDVQISTASSTPNTTVTTSPSSLSPTSPSIHTSDSQNIDGERILQDKLEPDKPDEKVSFFAKPLNFLSNALDQKIRDLEKNEEKQQDSSKDSSKE